MFAHFFHCLLPLLLVFFRLVAQGIVRYAAPDQLFHRGVKDIDHESAYRLIIHGCSRNSEPSESAPAPASSKAVIKSLQPWLFMGGTECRNGCVSSSRDGRPALCSELRGDGGADAVRPKRIARGHIQPRERLVLQK